VKALIILIVLIAGNAYAFDPPVNDPWYFQSDNMPTFWVPDKAQHYWGSYALSEVGQKYIGEYTGPAVAFTLGFLWEAGAEQVGFSYRDLIADGIGVLSSLVNKNRMTKLWMDYSTTDRTIFLYVSIKR